jgi:hypothetical protein
MSTGSYYQSDPIILDHFLEMFEADGGDRTKLTIYVDRKDVSDERLVELRRAGWRIWLTPSRQNPPVH